MHTKAICQEVEEVCTTLDKKKKQYCLIRGLLNENPRVFPSAISKVLEKGGESHGQP